MKSKYLSPNNSICLTDLKKDLENQKEISKNMQLFLDKFIVLNPDDYRFINKLIKFIHDKKLSNQ